jgi:hypothetical protein
MRAPRAPFPRAVVVGVAVLAVVASACGGMGKKRAGGCTGYPPDSPAYVGWGEDVSGLPVHPNSANFIQSINSSGGNGFLHADFGGGGAYGIPALSVPGSTPGVPVNFTAYGNQSDHGAYKIPLNSPVEGGSDRHVLALDYDNCILYELYRAFPQSGHWNADSGAIWNLNSSALRPPEWTSADAAGLPIYPGLVRFDELARGYIDHALRFTVGATQDGYILPATHWAGSTTNPNVPPMGLRLRLAAWFDTSGYTGQARVVLEALKRYGMIVADNGGSWFITGASDPRFNDTDLDQLKTVPGTAFEVVYTGAVCTGTQGPGVCS